MAVTENLPIKPSDLKVPFKLIFLPNKNAKEGVKFSSEAKVQTLEGIEQQAKTGKDNSPRVSIKEGDVFNIVEVKTIMFTYLPTPQKRYFLLTDNNLALPYNKSQYFIDLTPASETKQPTNEGIQNRAMNNANSDLQRKKMILFLGWGIFGFLAYKYWNKSNNWKIGIGILGLYQAYKTNQMYNILPLDKNVSNKSVSVPTNLSKTQKIDKIIDNMKSSGQATESETDEKNSRTFFNTLTDKELDTWLKISLAMKNENVNNLSDEQKFKILQEKYGLKKEEVQEALKKLMEFLMKATETFMQQQQ